MGNLHNILAKNISFLLIFSSIYSVAQINITRQGFQDWNNQVNGLGDSWQYSPIAQSNGIYTTNGSATPTYLTPRALKLEQYGGGEDRQIEFNNIPVNVSSYSSVIFSIAFASQNTDENGTSGRSPDDNENLYLDYSYNNGASWTAVKLIDGKDSTTSDVFAMGALPSLATAVPTGTNPYILTLSPTATQFKVRIRAVFDTGDFDIYWIDDLRLVGYTNNPEIEVLGANNNIADGSNTVSSTNNTDFGLYDINSGVKTRTYTIRNNGGSNLILGAAPVSFLGGSSSTFTIQSQPAPNFVLTPNATTNFTIAFNPDALVTTTATISIASNDTDENPFTFLIEGDGAQIYPDTDGDGVSNNLDFDDDNDGISDAFEQNTCLSSSGGTVVETVFLDENFGAGLNRVRINGTTPGVTTNYCFEDGTSTQAADECNSDVDLNDGKYTVHYSITDDNGITQISNTAPDTASWAEWAWVNSQDHTIGDTNGRMAIFNASNTPGIFYETIVSGILPNVPINYSFWAINIDKNDAAFGGGYRILPNITINFYTTDYATLLGSFNTGNLTRCSALGNACLVSEWKQFLTSVNLNQSEFIIQFVNNAPGGGGNDLAIDDIKITQTLCDIDSDGIADVLDLDNDNDGIPNIIEARMIPNPDPDLDATTQGTSWIDSNNNGWSDIFESLTPNDFDGDGARNYLDLDSDNDGVFDTLENDNLGDIDITGDGLGDGNDIKTFANNDEFDGDGILGIMDTNDTDNNASDHGNSVYSLPINSDSDGMPNYLDVYNNTLASYDISNTLHAFLDANNNGIIDGNIDADKDGILDSFDTNIASQGSPRNLNDKYSLFFDGRNDYVEENTNVVSGLTNASIMAWIKLDNTFSNDGIVAGQDKFYLKINNNKRFGIVLNGNAFNLTSATNILPTNKWIHIAAIHDGANSVVKLYLNGQFKASTTTSTIQTSSNGLFRIGRNPNTNDSDYFKGEIEEVRVFNTALTEDQLQKMVYQELKDTNFSMGDVIPLAINGLSATSLIRYYKMDTFKNDIVDNKVSPSIDLVTGAKLYNIKHIYSQTAPLPFQTSADGPWTSASSWKHGSTWDVNTMSNNMPWNIVQISHNVSSTSNHENLGLIIDSGKQLNLSGDLELKNNWYLKLNGKIDLNNKSQLVQTENSVLEPTSSGSIEREQTGIKNLFNYNYWSSPVSTINTISNNNGYTVNQVMKDATNPNNIQNINWIGGYNGASGTPISLARYWIFKFQNTTPIYANWASVAESGALLSGQGYTLKGSGNDLIGGTQNYAFQGKPNNGNITIPIAANNLNLSGNPYPSAIDSQQFILDNIDGGNSGSSNAINGTLHFWQHAPENNSHQLAAYKGGYATLNLVGGIAPIVPVSIAGLGTSNRIPNRFIPVGQGFFVYGDASGGNITFKNSQRGFKLETDNSATGSNPLFRSTQNETTEQNFKKIRIGITTPNNYNRQLLLGFMNNLATNNIEPGYDAEVFDNNPSDIYFTNSNKKLLIQGVGTFNNQSDFPLGVKTEMGGIVKFKIDTTENFDNTQQMFIHDNQNGSYNEITNAIFEINLPAGTHENRFSLRFVNQTLSVPNSEIVSQFNVFCFNNILEVKNNATNIELQNIFLYNIIGQEIAAWKIESNEKQIKLSLNTFAVGTYIVKLKTSKGDLTKKIIIN